MTVFSPKVLITEEQHATLLPIFERLASHFQNVTGLPHVVQHTLDDPPGCHFGDFIWIEHEAPAHRVIGSTTITPAGREFNWVDAPKVEK
jgi:hypothetical protein